MDKGWLKLSRVFIPLLVLFSCSANNYKPEPKPEFDRSVAATEPVKPKAATDSTPVEQLTVNLSATKAIDGSILLVDIQISHRRRNLASAILPKLTAQFEDIDIPLYQLEGREGVFEGVLGVPFNHKPGRASVKVRMDKDSAEAYFEIIAGNYKSELLHVDKEHAKPNLKNQRRKAREAAEAGALYKIITAKKYWKGHFALPLNSAVTSPFGNKRLFNGEMKSFHQGLDLRASVGTPIHAPAAGKVAMAKDLFMTGNTVILDHGYGVFTIYAHMSKLKVKKGDEVGTNQLLGLAGKTGRASGPHLHWGAVIQKMKVNPLDLTQVMN